jgi:hypothetical protein
MHQLMLPEGADAELERLLARETCPRHPGTTLDGYDCELCRIERMPEPVRRAAEPPSAFEV